MKGAVDVAARDGFIMWGRFDDGAEGVIDLGDLAGRAVFQV